MQGMILAAGLGTRLGELGKTKPKCLVDIGGKPILHYIVTNMKQAGVDRLVVNLHHCPEQIEAFFAANDDYGLDIAYSRERAPLETGGGIKHARHLLGTGDTILVHNGDIFCDAPLAPLVAAHQRHRAVATVLSCPTDDDKVLCFDEQEALVGWTNRRTGERIDAATAATPHLRGYGGIQVISAQLFTVMADQPARFSVVQTWLEAVRRGLPVFGHPVDDCYWMDIGTPAKVAALKAHLLSC